MAVTQRLPTLSKGWSIPRFIKPAHGLLAIAFVIALAHAVLGLSLLRQSSDEKALKKDAELSAKTLASLKSVNLDQMQTDLANAEITLAGSRNEIPRDSYTTAFVSDILATADRHALEVVSFQSGSVRKQIYGMYEYQARLITVVVRGTREDLTGFSESIGSTAYPLLIRSAQLETSESNSRLTVDLELFSRESDKPVPTPVKGKAPAKATGGSAK